MEVKIVCPLGSECEEIKGGEARRCAWYTKLAGQGPDGKPVDEWRCALTWMPILLVENSMTNRGQTAALESLRNETTQRQEDFNKLIGLKLRHDLVNG